MNCANDRSNCLALDFAQIKIGRGVLWSIGLVVLEDTCEIAFSSDCTVEDVQGFQSLEQRGDIARTMHDAHDLDLSPGQAIKD